MTHIVAGVIAKHGALAAYAQARRLGTPMLLAQGLDLLPLRPADIASYAGSTVSEIASEFEHLSTELIQDVLDASMDCLIAYFETEYWGGDGGQGAAVFHEGCIVFGPQFARIGPINDALALLGARIVPPAVDEFESVGLKRHRATAEWLATPGGAR